MESTRKYKVSIVTAVYNTEEYLSETIESIINQTIGFENVQMILVDDGSTDGSKEICDRYAAEYPENIIAVHKENGGVSSARNEGLKYVKGEYINFLDSDDKLEENALKVMYDYLEENKEWIDLVAIPLKFFGAREGGHPLNYKFKKTRIIDLKKEHNLVQLSLSSSMVKSGCFKERRFNTELAYGEDAQLSIDILLDKMSYGVISGASYLYRKRDTGNSAIDTGRMKKNYYIPVANNFLLYSIKNAIEKKGYLPKFVQYACMYDLQWRLNKQPLVEKGVLNEAEAEEYQNLLIEVVQYIDNDIIQEQKNLSDNYKIAILMLKEENKGRRELEYRKDDVRICIGDTVSAGVAAYSTVFEGLTVSSDEVIFEGYVRYFPELRDIEIVLVEKDKNIEYKAELIEREEKCTFFMGEVITQAKGFKFCISRNEMSEKVELQLRIRYQKHDIICKNIIFGKSFPSEKQLKSGYLYEEGKSLTYCGTVFIFSTVTEKKSIQSSERKSICKSVLKEKKEIAIEAKNVCINYRIMKNVTVQNNLFQKHSQEEAYEAVKNVSFTVEKGGILGIIGKNGSGKSTLLRAIAGVFSPNSGTIDLKGHTVSLMALGVGFKDNLTGRDNISLSGMLLGFSEKQIQEKMQEIIDFAEIGEFIDRPVRTYSSGMHSKLAFAITVMLETDIMLVDEVLSVGDERFKKKSLNKMKELINDKNRTVVIVSHSIDTLKNLCDRVMWIHDGKMKEIGEPKTVLDNYVKFMNQ